MKKPLLLSAILIAVSGFSYGQADYIMWESIYLKPKTENLKELGANMKAHNDKYHSQDPYRASVWSVTTGPRSGGMVWFMGPCTFSDLDNRPAGGGHDEDWRDNVMPHISDVSDGGYWRLMEGFSYQPENFTPKVMWILYIDVKRQKWDEFKHLMTTIMKNYETNKFSNSMSLYENVANDGSGKDAAIVWQYQKYADLDKNQEFNKKYEEIYGDNSWRDFMEAVNDYTEGTQEEMMEVMPALSSEQE